MGKTGRGALLGAVVVAVGIGASATTIAGAETAPDAVAVAEPTTEVPVTAKSGDRPAGSTPPTSTPLTGDSPWVVAPGPDGLPEAPTPGGDVGSDQPSTPAAGAASADVRASALPIAGWVADGDSSLPLGGVCVALYSVEGGDALAGSTLTGGDGSWSFVPDVEGSFRIAFYRPSVEGDCASAPLAAGPVPEWAFDQPLVVGDPTGFVPPPGAATIPDGSSGIGVCLGDAQLHVGGCDRRLGGNGTISGTVTRPGPEPVVSACIYVLAQVDGRTHGSGGMTDAEGRFVVSGLAEDLEYVVAAVPPFEEDGVPCQTEDGPPPPSSDGLQPEFYADVWIDLSAPEIDGDVVGWARAHGAQIVPVGATGIDVCLTPEAGDVEPRGLCGAAAPTAAAPADATATGAAPAATPVTGTLPLTGRSSVLPAALGAALLALGASAVVWARRRPAT